LGCSPRHIRRLAGPRSAPQAEPTSAPVSEAKRPASNAPTEPTGGQHGPDSGTTRPTSKQPRKSTGVYASPKRGRMAPCDPEAPLLGPDGRLDDDRGRVRTGAFGHTPTDADNDAWAAWEIASEARRRASHARAYVQIPYNADDPGHAEA